MLTFQALRVIQTSQINFQFHNHQICYITHHILWVHFHTLIHTRYYTNPQYKYTENTLPHAPHQQRALYNRKRAPYTHHKNIPQGGYTHNRHTYTHTPDRDGHAPYTLTSQRPHIKFTYNNRINKNTNNAKNQGCYNCGEFNHRQSTCRFDHRLRCEDCHKLGHKRRLCEYYSN